MHFMKTLNISNFESCDLTLFANNKETLFANNKKCGCLFQVGIYLFKVNTGWV